MKTELVYRVVPDPGETIYNVADEMARLTEHFDQDSVSEFNGTALTAKRGDTAADIVAYYFTSREKK